MASQAQITVGQLLKGRSGSYSVTSLLHEKVWIAKYFVVKQAPALRLRAERQVLARFLGCAHIRSLVDEVNIPPALILRHMDNTVLVASKAGKLTRRDVKHISRGVLEALKTFHSANLVHTDIKPDNILITYGSSSHSDNISEVALGDCGDVVEVDSNVDPTKHIEEYGHAIGAAVFRSPEAMLNLKFGCATDIWSFGATVITLLAGKGYLIFRPKTAKVSDEDYPKQVMLRMISWFFYDDDASIGELMDDERQQLMADLLVHAEVNAMRTPFHAIQWPDFTQEDIAFILRIMRFDPRNRPSAEQLLRDPWFDAD